MKSKAFYYSILAVSLLACKNNPKEEPVPEKTETITISRDAYKDQLYGF